ncbi:hypothetical protein BDN70DRAFT_881077 [Pholiota conissans]|uniref:RRM domain-containing protein n=1 Tax=Pholiota conissans TaxID=109636 RepID=A0A9P6CRW7_9AGAR|nr:hypothetical protein BDN70DRAFT_881077 [Pholiota conissans]
MSTSQKLTKKQKKGLAFRERKSGKRQGCNNELDDMEANAVPAMEDPDLPGGDGAPAEAAGDDRKAKGKAGGDAQGRAGDRKEGKVGSKGKGKAKAEEVSDAVDVVRKAATGQKRKREAEDREEGVKAKEGGENAAEKSSGKKSAKRKKTDGGDKPQPDGKGKPAKQRFILFLGNLKYTTPLSAIQAHFAACDPPPTIRLLTPKSISGGPAQKLKSKGCAFLEFTHRNALQQGLKLHQTLLDGRMINVELTAGGGGKSETRLTKVRERNKALLGQREERIEKEAKEDNSFPNLPSRPQRFSATSGMEHKPVTSRTWAAGNEDDGQTHRGGERHRKKSKMPSKTWGTGVNAIPVG